MGLPEQATQTFTFGNRYGYLPFVNNEWPCVLFTIDRTPRHLILDIANDAAAPACGLPYSDASFFLEVADERPVDLPGIP